MSSVIVKKITERDAAEAMSKALSDPDRPHLTLTAGQLAGILRAKAAGAH